MARAEAACSECPGDALSIEAVYTGELWRNASGGAATGNRYLDNLDLTFDADAGRLFGIDGLEIFGYLLYTNGHSISELSNTAQGISNIEASRAVRLYELWGEWQFGNEANTLRFGLYDLNSEFDSIETAGLFINPSHGIGPDFAQSGENGPSIFPVTSLGARAQTTRGAWTIQAAALDAVPGDRDDPDRSGIHLSSHEGALLVGEVNYLTQQGLRLGGGHWRYTSEFTTVDAQAARKGNAGTYVLAESPALFSDDEERGLRIFARTGIANDRINPIRRYYGTGAVYAGMNGEHADQIGLAFAVAELGQPYLAAQRADDIALARREYDVELTYRIEVSDWLTLQSDVQYVRNPAMDPTLESVWVFGLRFEAGYGWRF
jgi:porin